jgi:predicted dehydrogenase
VESPAQVTIDEESFEQGDALCAEIQSFIAAVRGGKPPLVDGEDGLRALQTALKITDLVNRAGLHGKASVM